MAGLCNAAQHGVDIDRRDRLSRAHLLDRREHLRKLLLSQVGVRKDEKRLDRVGQVEPFFGERCVGHASLTKVNFEVPVCLVLQAQQVQECSELPDLRTRPIVTIQFM